MADIKIKLNGQERTVEAGITVSQLLELLRIKPGVVVVEHNLNILKRAQHKHTVLNDGDEVEIIHFVGGG